MTRSGVLRLGHGMGRGAAGLLVCGLLASGGTAAPAELAQDAGLALETFDAAWELVRDTHYDPQLNGVDWEAVRERLRPRAATARDVEELRGVIEEMLATLGESHFSLWPRDAVDVLGIEDLSDDVAVAAAVSGVGEVGIEVVVLDGEVLVGRVRPGSAAAEAGVRRGWLVEQVDGIRPAEQLQATLADVEERRARLEVRRLVTGRLRGPPGAPVTVELVDGDGTSVTARLERRVPAAQLVKFGNLPPLPVLIESRRVRDETGIEAGIIGFNIWLPAIAASFDRAVDELRSADGMVLDLRGNPGGVGGMVMGIAGHFTDAVTSLGEMKMRDATLRFVSNPRRVDTAGERVEPFDGPLAILIDEATGSTSEVFAGGMQAIGRARVFGERSIGAVLPSMLDRLPNGDVLQHAIADFVTASGERLEGRGVVPDQEVAMSRDDLLADRDPVAEAALDWIGQQARVPGDGTPRRGSWPPPPQ